MDDWEAGVSFQTARRSGRGAVEGTKLICGHLNHHHQGG